MNRNILSKSYSFISILWLTILTIYISFNLGSKTVSTFYVDEVDNILVGKLINSGSVMYKDVFSHHQPIPYLISSLIQHISGNWDIYTQTVTHRLFIVVWSLIWWIVMIKSFGFDVVWLGTVVEIVKFYFLGSFFLAESIAIYPMLWLLLASIVTTNVDEVIIGIIGAITVLTLAPLWPFVLFVSCRLLIRNPFAWKKMFWGCLVVFGLVFAFTPIKEYLTNTVHINLKHYIPENNAANGRNFYSPFLGPINALRNPSSEISLLIIKLLSICLIVELILFLKNEKLRVMVIAFLILGLSGLRSSPDPFVYDSSFHLLPWVICLIGLVYVFRYHQIMKVIGTIAVLILIGGLVDVPPEFKQYPKTLIEPTRLINEIKQNGDRMFVANYDMVLYEFTSVTPALPYIFYYPWMNRVDSFNEVIENQFEKELPRFIYGNMNKYPLLEKYSDMYEAVRFEGVNEILYVRKPGPR